MIHLKIRNAFVQVVDLPLRVTFRTALRATNQVTDIRLVLETDDGLVGLGSASPTPAITGETRGSIICALEDHIIPRLRNIDLDDENLAFKTVQSALVHNYSAKAAADIALHDLYAKKYEVPLFKRIGQSPIELATDATVSLSTIADMVEQADGFVRVGFNVAKVKLGGRDGHDIDRITQIRARIGENVTLRVDANQAWNVKESIQYAYKMVNLGVDLIEQPVPAWDIEGLKTITEASIIPIAADESVFGMTELLRVLELRAADIINLKLMKTGGITVALQMARLIESAGLEWMVGSMMEGPISVTAAAIFAAANGCRHIDLDAGYFLKERKATGGIEYEGPQISLPYSVGLGITNQYS